MSETEIEEYDATLYDLFDTDDIKYSPSHGYNDGVTEYDVDGQKKELPNAVVELLEIIFDQNEIESFLDKHINEYIDKSRFGEVVSNFLGGGCFGELVATMGKALLTNKRTISFAADMVQSVMMMSDAKKIMDEFINDPNAIYMYYKALNTKIRPLEKNTSEFEKIKEFVENTQDSTQTEYTLEIVEVFKISRNGELESYKPHKETLKHKKLLWHGSRLGDYASILSKGLQIGPSSAIKNGSMFGDGIYFADMVSKSAIYCETNSISNNGIVLIAEVALGETYELKKAENVELPFGKNSVKALGKIEPNKDESIYTKTDIEVPLGKPIEHSDDKFKLTYNEYVVYDPSQVLFQYLVQLKFNYK